MEVKTDDAIKWAKGTTKLGAIFGVTHSAVSQWGDKLPRARVFELRLKRPRWFNRDGSMKEPPREALETNASRPKPVRIEGLAPAVLIEPGKVEAQESPPSVFPGG